MTIAATQLEHTAATSLRKVQLIRVAAWLVALASGALQVAAERFPIGEDGVSYLDIADQYLQGHWAAAVNAYWSPLYSWILAAGFGIARPTPYFESTVVHIVNFLIYVCALA